MSTTLNTYQLCAEEYLGDVETNINRTTADRFEIGYTAANNQRGIDMGATIGVNNAAFIDFNSLNGGTNDYDTRLLSVSGEAGVDGRGILLMIANEYQFNGNSVNNQPAYGMPGYIYQPAMGINVGTNQGRTLPISTHCWTGSGGTQPVNPVITIQLRDPVSLTPWFGVYDVYMSSGYAGTGDAFSSANWVIAKNATPPTDILEVEPARAGPALAVLYAEAEWNATGYPQLLLYNKQAGSTFRYMVRATVFYNNNGF